MSRRKRFVFVMLLVICVALFSRLGHAQYRGSLRGTLTDPQGLVIPGATVTLVNTDTNRTIVSTSDANGIYQFNALEPAPYRLTAEAQGFKKRVLDHVRLIPEQLNALDRKSTRLNSSHVSISYAVF